MSISMPIPPVKSTSKGKRQENSSRKVVSNGNPPSTPQGELQRALSQLSMIPFLDSNKYEKQISGYIMGKGLETWRGID